jgi:hypothetical protein
MTPIGAGFVMRTCRLNPFKPGPEMSLPPLKELIKSAVEMWLHESDEGRSLVAKSGVSEPEITAVICRLIATGWLAVDEDGIVGPRYTAPPLRHHGPKPTI